jgi:hypothetical protein
MDPLAELPRQQFMEKALMNRDRSGTKASQPLLVIVDDHDIMPQLREATSRDQTDISGTNHRDAHE